MRFFQKKNLRTKVSVALLGFLFQIYSFVGHAHITSISGGVAFPTPMGEAYQKVERTLGFMGRFWIYSDVLPTGVLWHLTVNYQPLQVRNLEAKVNLLGLWFGPKIVSPGTLLGIQHTLALEAGLLYNWLGFSGASSTTSNSSMAPGVQFSPGMAIPITGRTGLDIEFPLTVGLFKTTTIFWGVLSSLRVRL